MPKDKKLSAKDSELFQRSVGLVRRLADDKVTHRPERPSPHPRRRPAESEEKSASGFSDSLPFDTVSASDPLFFARPGLQQRLLQRLHRGQLAIGAELDLHGMTAAIAHNTVAQFLTTSRDCGIRCVSIIHGKGYGGKANAPILKNRLNNWLRQHHDVLAFCSSRQDHGGTGAVYVLLRTKR
jgi:DNA-nicking Smr family endonuclease